MTRAAYALAAFLALVWFVWVLFAAIMNAKRVRDAGKLTRAAHLFATVALAVGYPLDVLLMLAFCFVLLDPPQEVTLSGKLWRLSQGGGWWGWQRKTAEALRAALLDNFDPAGQHRG